MKKNLTAVITGVSCYLPEYILFNRELETMMETTDEWIQARSGIRERRILKDKTKASAFMGAEAAMKLLMKKKIPPEQIDLIILCTATPEMQFPATANIISHMIGAKNAWSFDLMAACSGFVYALFTGSLFIQSGGYKKILVIGSDKMSSITDYSDRTTSILFGDAAGCVLLEPDKNGYGVLDAKMYVDGSGKNFLYQPAGGSLKPASENTVSRKEHFIKMDGKSVFKIAVTKMADVAEEMMKRNQLSANDIAFFVPHQANRRIIEAAAQRMGIGMEKVMLNIQHYGNTTTASIPLCLCEWENQLKRGDNLVLASFGAGFTWGGIYLKWAYSPSAGR